jgi:hypothetical protein
MAPLKLDKLPVIGYLLKWFKTDDPVIDNDLFRLHHQVPEPAIVITGN